jgi:hypothetical protein
LKNQQVPVKKNNPPRVRRKCGGKKKPNQETRLGVPIVLPKTSQLVKTTIVTLKAKTLKKYTLKKRKTLKKRTLEKTCLSVRLLLLAPRRREDLQWRPAPAHIEALPAAVIVTWMKPFWTVSNFVLNFIFMTPL